MRGARVELILIQGVVDEGRNGGLSKGRPCALCGMRAKSLPRPSPPGGSVDLRSRWPFSYQNVKYVQSVLRILYYIHVVLCQKRSFFASINPKYDNVCSYNQ